VRELQNAAERALILAQRGTLHFDLPLSEMDVAHLDAGGTSDGNNQDGPILTETELRLRERQNLVAALSKAQWKIHGQGGAAELLGVKPTTLISRIKKLGLERP
jgi:transcriptional regulator with GAF, ATPase, and Fis domain